ncbi:MAG TPA: hypothetical protein VNF27_07555 [Candidatus Binataceae bacterium]|nr:hypothetical protein [Candidatus Binataceae bacterium]
METMVSNGSCAICGGEMMRESIRPAAALAKFRAPAQRVVKQGG